MPTKPNECLFAITDVRGGDATNAFYDVTKHHSKRFMIGANCVMVWFAHILQKPKEKTMGKYIDREAMLEQIARRESLMVGNKMISIDALRAFIMNRPVADAVPVIRCKDCKWYWRDKLKGGFCRKSGASMWSPGLPIDELKPDDYCSRAQRKDDENGRS